MHPVKESAYRNLLTSAKRLSDLLTKHSDRIVIKLDDAGDTLPVDWCGATSLLRAAINLVEAAEHLENP